MLLLEPELALLLADVPPGEAAAVAALAVDVAAAAVAEPPDGVRPRNDCRSLAKLDSALVLLEDVLEAVRPADVAVLAAVDAAPDENGSMLEKMLLIDMSGLLLRRGVAALACWFATAMPPWISSTTCRNR